MKFSDLIAQSTEERAASITAMTDEVLTASIAEARAETKAALDKPNHTIAEVDAAEVMVASVSALEAEERSRTEAATRAAERLAAARQSFAINDGVESSSDADEESGDEEDEEDDSEDDDSEEESDDTETDGEDGVEAAAGDAPFPPKKKDEKKTEEPVTTASARNQRRIPAGSAAKKVGARTQRPAKATTPDVVITASANVEGFAMNQRMENGLDDLAVALINSARGFAPHSESLAQRVRQSGKMEDLRMFGLAQIGHHFDSSLVASSGGGMVQPGKEYGTVQEAVKQYKEALVASIDGLNKGTQGHDGSLTAAGWCAPSEVTYTWLADYVTSGLMSLPQVKANRGGLMLTTGPALQDEYAMDGSDFGFGGTEAQAEAGYVKTCETIVCPDFVDHRLDFIGYCWKFPLLTEAAFPELVRDALRLSSVLFAHRMNKRRIADITGLSVTSTISGLGATFTDTLEALTAIAVKERRRLNMSDTAVMEVKMPLVAKEIFRADVSRRMNRDVGAVTDQQINAEFTARHLSPEYLSDMADGTGDEATFPATFPALIYPAGTFVEAVKDVINVKSVYDAASLSVNEYTGVFFEQGFKVIQAGYKSHKMTIPVCTAGFVGAAVLDCSPNTLNTEGADADAAA